MPITLDIQSGQIDAGDTKRLGLTPRDTEGDPMDPAQLEVTVTPPDGSPSDGDEVVYKLTGATGDERPVESDEDGYYVMVGFDAAGFYDIECVATDSAGNTETERSDDPIYAHP